ncbi:hypothetical protein BIV57_22385 [Mangrovactinospora gilvigrisea]|uniref:Glycolipid-binding domain-containing protein n=1 Tax=Mangrovactinospora gilvigrisea TaxID=1428644 RepID=A0A1J7B9L4_9ACTN|nr:hypothetical protein [Mangrovactinospora gilvigrisea]OIV35285.1 hypothetical protein BIV57_22385 [Mangrovactinospora gilvigrisea]
MPAGRYLLTDPYDGTPLGAEHFRCAPGPAGWRYTARTTGPDGRPSGSVDLTTDSAFRPLRLELRTADWQLRGAALDGVTWVRADLAGLGETQDGNAPARAFTGRSPGFLVALARLLRPTADGIRVRLVAVTHPVLAAHLAEQRWTLLGTESHPTDDGPLTVEKYQVVDVDTGEPQHIHLAGDVVLDAPGVELDSLDGPPSPSMCIPPR